MQTRRHVSTESRPCGHRPQRNTDRTINFRRCGVERGRRVRTDPQFSEPRRPLRPATPWPLRDAAAAGCAAADEPPVWQPPSPRASTAVKGTTSASAKPTVTTHGNTGIRCRAGETIRSATSRGRAAGGNTIIASTNAKAAPVTTPLSRTMFRRSPAAEPKPVSTCQAVPTRTPPSSPARSTAISLSLRRLSRSRPTCRTTCGTAALVLRHVPQAAAVASKPQPAAYRVRVRAAGADRGLSRGPVVAT
jgi:hypothetical protein